MKYDKIIIGAGIYGLYAALQSGKSGKEKILVLEKEDAAFKRATYINQARVHMGYHYPRSYSTAIKSAHYFERFNKDYDFSILSEFDQVYATSSNFSWTNAEQFKKFCKDANIVCEELSTSKYFKDRMCDGCFLTKEYTYDAQILKDYFLNEISKHENIKIMYSNGVKNIEKTKDFYEVSTINNEKYKTVFLLNATYGSVNQILDMLGLEHFKIKYELCEIILCKVSEKFKNIGITVMDGPFFSIMPFGKTGYHSLTSVTFTPHMACYESLPRFSCQERANKVSPGYCTPNCLGNCNECPAKPESAWPYMSNLAKKYLKEEFGFEYVSSLYSMKPILLASEIDDSRPTVIKKFTTNPTFISVLSGKINTVYDLDEVLKNE